MQGIDLRFLYEERRPWVGEKNTVFIGENSKKGGGGKLFRQWQDQFIFSFLRGAI